MNEEHLDEWLDVMFGFIVINGITFDASRILKQLDPVAYAELLEVEG